MSTTEFTGAEDVAWDLSDLYSGVDDPRIEEHVEETDSAAAAFRERYYGRVAELSPAELLEAIEERERIESIFTRAIYFAHLQFATDMNDSPRGALVARLTEKGATIDTQLLFFGLELAALEDEQADAFLASDELEHWRHWLQNIRKFRPYVLTEPEEKILTEKAVSGFSAWDRLYDELLGAIKVDLDGTEIGFEEAMAKLQSADRDLRRRASEAVTEALAPGLKTRTYVFNTIAVDRSIDDRLRGYATWISARNLANDTTDEAVEALVDAVVGRYDVVQRYYTLKAKLLGLDRLAVVHPRSESSHLVRDRLIAPSPGADHDQVGPVAHEHPCVEQRLEVLAGLDRPHEEDEAFRQSEAGARVRPLLRAHRAELLRHAVRDDVDAAPVEAEELLDIPGRRLRHRDQDVSPEDGPRNHDSRAQGLAGWKPARVAVDRQVVHRYHRRGADAAKRHRAGGSEVDVRPQAANLGRPLKMPADEAGLRQQPVVRARRVHDRATGTKNDEVAVGPLHGHGAKDLRRVDAHPGARTLEARSVDDHVEIRQDGRSRSHARGSDFVGILSGGRTGFVSALRSFRAPGRCRGRPTSAARRR